MILEIIIFALFTLLSLVLSSSTLIGVPGGWIFLVIGILLEIFDQEIGLPKSSFGAWVLISSSVLIVISELLELAASMIGTKFGGGSKKGMWGSFFGTIFGAILGTFFIPIPLIGSLLGALLGAFFGAYIVESNAEGNENALRAAIFATIGRFFGAFGKLVMSFTAATIMIIFLANNYFLA